MWSGLFWRRCCWSFRGLEYILTQDVSDHDDDNDGTKAEQESKLRQILEQGIRIENGRDELVALRDQIA